MIVAGIESSCDETAVALVKDGKRVLSSVVSSQVRVHRPFGGVIPEIAAREHLRSISYLFDQALLQAGTQASDIDLIAVTRGPGLVGALLVGISFARGIALALDRPLIGVDHVHAHVHGAMLGLGADASVRGLFPALALVVSGGHTNLYRMPDPLGFRLEACTLDDACGECFDKVARLMGLGYPGGPEIEKAAKKGQPDHFPMPQIVRGKDRMAFSYSGLKTHVARLWEKHAGFQGQDLCDLASSFQDEALGQLRRKTVTALANSPHQIRSVLVAGGVAANLRFRKIMSQLPGGIQSLFPDPAYCSDNAAMVAALGWYSYQQHLESGPPLPEPDSWDAYPRYQYDQSLNPDN